MDNDNGQKDAIHEFAVVLGNNLKELHDPLVDAIRTLAQGIVTGDRELLAVITEVIKKVDLLEARVFELECQLQEGPSTGRRTH